MGAGLSTLSGAALASAAEVVSGAGRTISTAGSTPDVPRPPSSPSPGARSGSGTGYSKVASRCTGGAKKAAAPAGNGSAGPAGSEKDRGIPSPSLGVRGTSRRDAEDSAGPAGARCTVGTRYAAGARCTAGADGSGT